MLPSNLNKSRIILGAVLYLKGILTNILAMYASRTPHTCKRMNLTQICSPFRNLQVNSADESTARILMPRYTQLWGASATLGFGYGLVSGLWLYSILPMRFLLDRIWFFLKRSYVDDLDSIKSIGISDRLEETLRHGPPSSLFGEELQR